MDKDQREFTFGTVAADEDAVELSVGAWRANIAGGALRGLSWRGVEIVRGIDCPIRDDSWRTALPEAVSDDLDAAPTRATFRRTFAAMNGALACEVSFHIDAGGVVDARFSATARRAVVTNRTGFTLLHPLHGVVGAGLDITHSDGSVESIRFPTRISPSQPAFDITRMTHAVGPVRVEIAFDGEVFEMEDQRNWTDASYKTYCRPLALPFPYRIEAGETVTQAIRIEVTDRPASAEAVRETVPSVHGSTSPVVMLAADDDWWADDDAHRIADVAGCRDVLARVDQSGVRDWLPTAVAGKIAHLEVVVPAEAEPQSYLANLAIELERRGTRATSVTALPEPYLKSYQPDGEWPAGPTPADAARAARAAFPDARIGVGVLTNFTELNRCRPEQGIGDFITHGTAAIVHAADDRSVLETLEALPDVHASARAIGGERAYRLGLSAIGMRDNPYGAAVAENPDGGRVAMARDDPRHHALFGAAFAVGVVASAVESGAEAIALAAPRGPFGLAAVDQGRHRFRPIFHVVRALNQVAGKPAERLGDLPDGLFGLLVRQDAGPDSRIIANCSAASRSLTLAGPSSVRTLGVRAAEPAASDAAWLERPATTGSSLDLAPFEVAFVDLPGSEAPQ